MEDARVAAGAGADAIGLVFYPPSSRHVADLTIARDIAQSVGPFVTVVGLLVDPDAGFVERLLQTVPLHILQFHGEESPEFCGQFFRPFIKALRMKQGIDVPAEMARYKNASGFLLDAYKKGVPGGTGESFDWQRVPITPQKPLVLAGGLSPENVATAVKIVEPFAVDVSGGVESSPGIKDKDKVKAFIANAKAE